MIQIHSTEGAAQGIEKLMLKLLRYPIEGHV